MSDENAFRDAKTLWQSQSVELPLMNIEFIRMRVQETQRAERTEALSGYTAFTILTMWVIWITAFWHGKAPGAATWLPRLIALLLYAGVFVHGFRWRRVPWPRVYFGEDSNLSGLQAYRTELERLRDIRRKHADLTLFLPGYLVWVVSWWSVPLWPRHVVIFIFAAATLATALGWSWWNGRADIARLNKEIDLLRQLEK